MWRSKNVLCEGVGGIQLARVSVHWKVPVNTVMNLRVLQKLGNVLLIPH